MIDDINKMAADMAGTVWLGKQESLLFPLLKIGKLGTPDPRLNHLVETMKALVDTSKTVLPVVFHGQISDTEFSIVPMINDESRKAIHVFVMRPAFYRDSLLVTGSPMGDITNLKVSHRLWIEGDGTILIMVFLPSALEAEWRPLQRGHALTRQTFVPTAERATRDQLKGHLASDGLYVVETTIRATSPACIIFRIFNNHAITKNIIINLLSNEILGFGGTPLTPGIYHFRQYIDYVCASIERDGDIVRIACFTHLLKGILVIDIAPASVISLQPGVFVPREGFETLDLKFGKTDLV